jgi:nucleotide-binding universal stress UspA family protein
MPRIMVATDGSPGANRAVDAAVKLARSQGSDLLIATVGGAISGSELRRLADIQGDLSAMLESTARAIVDRARKRALRSGVSAVQVQVRWGDPAEALIGLAEREDVDLLVVGRRGRSRLSGILMGSVSQKLTSLAPCKVLVVP